MTGPVPTKAERRTYLLAHGWTRIAATCWQHDRYGPAHFFTLAAAYRTESGTEAATLADAQALVDAGAAAWIDEP